MERNNIKKHGFFLEGKDRALARARAVLLIHGITGTPAEMHYLGKSLNSAGYTVFCNTLPRHCDTLKELKKVTWSEIADACTEDLVRLRKEYSKVFVGGLSMGALMSMHLAYKFPERVSGIIALAPTVFYDGWALHKGKIFLDFIWHIPFLRNALVIREGWPYGLKDEQLRENIHRFYKNAKASQFDNKVSVFGSPFFPAACLYQHQLFAKLAKKELSSVGTPILILHAREDDMTSLENAHYIFNHIGSSNKSLVVLENSYHMITIDKDKDRVAEEVIGFLNEL